MRLKSTEPLATRFRPATRSTTPLSADVVFACPRCRSPLDALARDALICPRCNEPFEKTDGIWRFLLSEQSTYYAPFIADYETIRQAEGRGSHDPAYYRALPDRDLTGRFADDWRIRSKSYHALVGSVIQPLEQQLGRPLDILDLGAGNGWLSNRLADRGHHVVAVDLLTNDFDGLGAYHFYDSRFTPVQAAFDSLPLPDDSADVVVFNGALHYSTDYRHTLAEAQRVLRDNGRVVILDSPVYRGPSSGEQMIRERQAHFERSYGFPSNALPSEGYLTFDRLEELGLQLGLNWRLRQPWYGLKWTLRPWKAMLLRRREPARFLLIVGTGADTASRQSIVHRGLRHLARLWLRARFTLTQRHRHRRLTLEHVGGFPIIVLPDVFNPALFRSGALLAKTLGADLIPPGSSVLDMGTGTGIGAIASAKWASRVLAVDINPEAVRCARINTLMNQLEDCIEIREGDLFTPVAGKRFDVVLFNPPYFRGEPSDQYDHAWRSINTVDRFATELEHHLSANGSALLVLSSDGDAGSFLTSFRDKGYLIEVVARHDYVNERMTIYRMRLNR